MRTLIFLLALSLQCTLCWSAGHPKVKKTGDGNTSTLKTTKGKPTIPTTAKKTTAIGSTSTKKAANEEQTKSTTPTTKKTTTEKRSTPPPVDCKLPRCYLLTNNSCFTPTHSPLFDDKSQNFNEIFATCQGTDETRYILNHFMLNTYLDAGGKFNLSSPEVVAKLKDQEAILFCILKNLGIVQEDKKLIESAAIAAINNTMQASYWVNQLTKALIENCKYVVFVSDAYVIVIVQCIIYVAMMKTLDIVSKGKKDLGGLTWTNDAFCNTTMTTMLDCNKRSSFNTLFKEPNDGTTVSPVPGSS